MVQISTLVTVLVSAALAVNAVPVNGRTYESDKSMEQGSSSSYGGDQKGSQQEYGGDQKGSQQQYGGYEQPQKDKTTSAEKMESSPAYEAATSSSEVKAETTYSAKAETTQAYTSSSSEATYAAQATSSSVYGSGSWDKSGYNDCVSQCMAKFGGGSASAATYAAASTGSTQGSSGSGATHTVIVAPTQGVLRYVPAFVNAAVGDTVLFKWGANNHTVTKSSQLLPCNKTADALFASGTQNKDFTFTQVVNDTNPTYFYCATPGHCAKGMFGVINPANSSGNSSASNWIPSGSNSSNSSAPAVASNSTSSSNSTGSSNSSSSDLSGYLSYTQTMTANNAAAANWGASFDMSSIPEWAQESMAANILYTRNVMAMNPEVVDASGNVNLASNAPLMLPKDVNNAASTESTSTASSASGASATAGGSAAAQSSAGASPAGAAAQPNGAGTITSSKYVMGAAVAFGTFFLL